MRITSRFIDSRVNAEPIVCASGQEFCLYHFQRFSRPKILTFPLQNASAEVRKKSFKHTIYMIPWFSDILCKSHLSFSIRYLTENLSCLLIFNLQWWLCQVGREPITIILNVHFFRKWYLYQILSDTNHIIEWRVHFAIASYFDAGEGM